MHGFENWAIKERPIKNSMSKTVTNYTKLQEIYPTVAMLLAVSSQTAFIYNSKDMPKERKIPLLLNNLINCVLAVAGGLLINKQVTKLVDKVLKRANIVYASNPNKANLTNGIKTAIPFLVSAVMFKYIGAVLATPLADKANRFLVKKGIVKYSDNK